MINKTIASCRLDIQRLYVKAIKLGITKNNHKMNYPDCIHNLWDKMLTHPEFKAKATEINESLYEGDAIELLSEAVLIYRTLN